MITPEDLERGVDVKASDPDRRLGAILVDLGILTEDQVTEALGLQFMLPVVNVGDYITNVVTYNVLPMDLMERLNAFPLELQDRGSVLLVAISDPLDVATQEELRKAASLELRFALAPAGAIRKALLMAQNSARPKLSDVLSHAEGIRGALSTAPFPSGADAAMPNGGTLRRRTEAELGQGVPASGPVPSVARTRLSDILNHAEGIRGALSMEQGTAGETLPKGGRRPELSSRGNLAEESDSVSEEPRVRRRRPVVYEPGDEGASYVEPSAAPVRQRRRPVVYEDADGGAPSAGTPASPPVRHRRRPVVYEDAGEGAPLAAAPASAPVRQRRRPVVYETDPEDLSHAVPSEDSGGQEQGPVAEAKPQDAVSAPEPLNSVSEPRNASPAVVPEVVPEMEAPRPEPEAVGPSAAVVTDSQDGRSAGDTQAASASADDRALIPSFAALHARQPKLGDILVQAGVIDESQLVRALQIQQGSKDDKRKLGEVLVSEKFITETRLAEALSTQLKLPLFTLTRYRPMPEAIRLVPRAVAERLGLIPLSIMEDDLLLVAMSNPLDLLAQDEVRMLTGRNLKIGIATASDINQNLDRLYNLQNNLEEAIEEVDTESMQNLELDFDSTSADEAPVIQLVSNLLQQAVREGASDIHVEVYEKTARVRFRVDGQLYSAFDYPVALHPSVSARLKIMSGMDIAEKRKPQDGRILIRVDGRRIDLRVSVLPTMNGEKVVLRILDQESSAVGLDRLGLEADDMEKIDLFCDMPWGIMLVTGPTGSGKSTTLYSMLQKINQPDVNIITVEDPVEFSVAGINQVHVNEKAGLTFESALRSILRQDPDKVMVGEIRDQKTAQIAIRAALTGHFVLSTLHTNDAPSAATRMVDMGVPPFLVSASLSGVIAQRLVRRLCPICREEYELNENMCETLNVPVGTHAFRPRGCNECRNGYKGRRGIYEIMMVDDELRRMILEGVSNIQLRAEAIKRGMKTLRQSGINNALAGHTSLEEVFATTL